MCANCRWWPALILAVQRRLLEMLLCMWTTGGIAFIEQTSTKIIIHFLNPSQRWHIHHYSHGYSGNLVVVPLTCSSAFFSWNDCIVFYFQTSNPGSLIAKQLSSQLRLLIKSYIATWILSLNGKVLNSAISLKFWQAFSNTAGIVVMILYVSIMTARGKGVRTVVKPISRQHRCVIFPSAVKSICNTSLPINH